MQGFQGSDGTQGAGHVKTQGGTVIVQNPETAAHPSMPRSLPPTIVDFVANVDRIGELLAEPRLDLPTADLAALCERAVRNHDPCISCSAHFLDLHIHSDHDDD